MPHLSRLLSGLRHFRRARDGATAVEFGLIAVPMLMLIFGTIELGMVLLVSSTLDTATDYAAREIRTGRFQGGGASTESDFRQLMCEQMTWLGGTDCKSKVFVEAQTFSNFATASTAAIEDPEKFDPDTKRCWSVGNQGDIVVVRTYYDWPLFTPLLSSALANRNDDSRLISAARAFKNEPFGGAAAQGAKCVKAS